MRVAVLGTSGSGKTTFARRLAAAIGAPHIELDALNWQPGWRDLNSHDPEEFRRRVALAAAGEAWVSDGNYGRVRDLILARATHLVWLDYPRWLVMTRVFRRSLSRAMTGRELWPGTGNREQFSRWLDKEHPLRWAWDTYSERRRRYRALFEDPELTRIGKHCLRRPAEAEPLIRRLRLEAAEQA
jgi:adenylate kinase family enzyme